MTNAPGVNTVVSTIVLILWEVMSALVRLALNFILTADIVKVTYYFVSYIFILEISIIDFLGN